MAISPRSLSVGDHMVWQLWYLALPPNVCEHVILLLVSNRGTLAISLHVSGLIRLPVLVLADLHISHLCPFPQISGAHVI